MACRPGARRSVLDCPANDITDSIDDANRRDRPGLRDPATHRPIPPGNGRALATASGRSPRFPRRLDQTAASPMGSCRLASRVRVIPAGPTRLADAQVVEDSRGNNRHRAGGRRKPRPRSCRYRITPRPASSPNALPPVSRIASTLPDQTIGSAGDLFRVCPVRHRAHPPRRERVDRRELPCSRCVSWHQSKCPTETSARPVAVIWSRPDRVARPVLVFQTTDLPAARPDRCHALPTCG